MMGPKEQESERSLFNNPLCLQKKVDGSFAYVICLKVKNWGI